jgi:predicted nucleic acid-binding protein
MIVYVESNFVLEMALLREEHEHCETLMEFGRAGVVYLVVPAFSLGEPYEAYVRRVRKRGELRRQLLAEVEELSRSKPYADSSNDLRGLATLLTSSGEEEKERLDRALTEVAALAEIVPTDADVVRAAIAAQLAFNLSPQDSFVYASILRHARTVEGEKCFATLNSRDFTNPEIRTELRATGCRLVTRFSDAVGFVRSRANQG